MKKLLTLIFVAGAHLCAAQQAFYDVTPANGNGIRFWQQDNSYKIHMGTGSEYFFGPVQDYSIKMNMSGGTPSRGWTWGVAGQTPVAAISTLGNMQIAGTFQSGHVTASGSASTEETIFNASNFSDQDFNVRVSGVGAATKRTIIGPSTPGRFSLGVGIANGNEYLTILNGGNVGIGTTTPVAKLHMIIPISTSTVVGDPNAYGAVISDNSSSTLAIRSLGSGTMHLTTDGSGRKLVLGGGNFEQTLFVNSGGNVGIGTSSPDAKLAVAGQIHAQEVKVSVTVPGPDYVFEKNYKLTSLEEIKNYIDQNKHLPEVPSAKEMEKNGVQLGEMNMLLLKKIEELTLYVIEQNKREQTRDDQIEKLLIEVERLKYKK
jgi:hypothetical protein